MSCVLCRPSALGYCSACQSMTWRDELRERKEKEKKKEPNQVESGEGPVDDDIP